MPTRNTDQRQLEELSLARITNSQGKEAATEEKATLVLNNQKHSDKYCILLY